MRHALVELIHTIIVYFFRGKQLLGVKICLFIIKIQEPMESCLKSALHYLNWKASYRFLKIIEVLEGLISEF